MDTMEYLKDLPVGWSLARMGGKTYRIMLRTKKHTRSLTVFWRRADLLGVKRDAKGHKHIKFYGRIRISKTTN